MLSGMVQAIEAGEIPAKSPLQGRLRAALIKKMAWLQQPVAMRSPDSKLNPATIQLVWAAIIVGDAESLDLSLDIFLTELSEQDGAAMERQLILADCRDKLLALAPDRASRAALETLSRKIDNSG
ncbi:MAG: hypothetical protein ABFR97_04480 [Thermodesulfobacteriota bacterium]